MRKNGKVAFICLAVLLVLCGCQTEEAECPTTIIWERIYDSGHDDIGWDVAVDSEGSVYVTGSVNNGSDLDWHIIKYDSNGNILWAKTWDSGNGDDESLSIEADQTGNVYVGGWFNNGLDLDIRLVKYDTSGNLIWQRTYDSGGDDWGYTVAVDNTGNVFLAGRQGYGTVTDCIYFVKYGPAGGMVWEKLYDLAATAEGAFGIVVDAAGFIYIHAEVFTGEPGDGYDLLTLKLGMLGNSIWSRIIDTGKADYTSQNPIAVDNAGNIYICGWHDNDLTPSTYDWFVIKYDAGGNIIWNKTFASNTDEAAFGITLDSEGYIYVIGRFDGSHTQKLDPNGNLIWEASENGVAFGVVVDDAGFVYVTGNRGNSTDTDCLTIKYRQN